MRVTIRRKGGYSGESETLTVKDSTRLTSAEASTLHTTLDKLKSLADEHRPVGADFIKYELLIEDAGSKETVTFADDGSDKAQQLVQLVNTISNGKGT
jgi:hypothetical protein